MRYNEVQPDVILRALRDLTVKERDLIIKIYKAPGSMMNPKEVEKATGLKSIHVGNAGKHLGQRCGVDDFGSYWDGPKRGNAVAYFQMIGEYDRPNGWCMNKNLRIAVKMLLEKSEPR